MPAWLQKVVRSKKARDIAVAVLVAVVSVLVGPRRTKPRNS
jgi:hypothetical protein